jgi:hypothetical protein
MHPEITSETGKIRKFKCGMNLDSFPKAPK